jgi:hypothetical protein
MMGEMVGPVKYVANMHREDSRASKQASKHKSQAKQQQPDNHSLTLPHTLSPFAHQESPKVWHIMVLPQNNKT